MSDSTGTRDGRIGPRLLLGAACALMIGLMGWVGIDHYRRMTLRVEELETRLLDAPRLARSLDRRIIEVQGELEGVRDGLDSARREAGQTSDLSRRLNGAEVRLDDIGRAIEAHGSTLADLEMARSTFGPEALEAKLAERDRGQRALWQDLERRISSTSLENRRSLERLYAALPGNRDLVEMWGALVAPVAQLAGANSIGSGTLLASIPSETEEGRFDTYLLTAWHVVRDIIEGDEGVPIPVTIYGEEGSLRFELATLLEHEKDLDIALLILDTGEAVRHGAKLATRKRIRDVRIFDRVYAVGCPLGNDPIPTPGEISTNRHSVDGIVYWMINAPTYIGNSGGGIFDAESYELMGIFSKIYTHGALRPTIVPHMGLVTPLGGVYDWMDSVGYGWLIPSNPDPEVVEASSDE